MAWKKIQINKLLMFRGKEVVIQIYPVQKYIFVSIYFEDRIPIHKEYKTKKGALNFAKLFMKKHPKG